MPGDALDLQGHLLEQFEPGPVAPEFGTRVLSRHIKQGSHLPGTELDRYALAADLKLNGSNYGLRFKHKYFDATFNFCLTFDDELIATLGFEIEGTAMLIWQIQGVRGQGERLAPIRWSRALLEHAVEWARDVGATEAYVASIDHNEWAARRGHLDRGRGKLLYDVTAKRSGFKRGEDGYYRLAIDPAH